MNLQFSGFRCSINLTKNEIIGFFSRDFKRGCFYFSIHNIIFWIKCAWPCLYERENKSVLIGVIKMKKFVVNICSLKLGLNSFTTAYYIIKTSKRVENCSLSTLNSWKFAACQRRPVEKCQHEEKRNSGWEDIGMSVNCTGAQTGHL